ncbi:hypothetical protein ACILE9_07230 [Capnocytophaga cynodegmi]|uniref:hypothetical protein n=1 Tax=Capnocytophaga cynodegmi TaxID=28189 RepID=UPI0037CF6A9B
MRIGDFVKVSIYTNDPLNRQGQTGRITGITIEDEENSVVEVQFTDGLKGAYYDNCLTVLK